MGVAVYKALATADAMNGGNPTEVLRCIGIRMYSIC